MSNRLSDDMSENDEKLNQPEANEEGFQIPLEEKDVEDMTPMERFFFHQRRALEETGKALEALLPPGFREHGAEASREFAKGFRVLVDAAIDELKRVSEKDEEAPAKPKNEDEDDDENRPSSTGKGKVKIDVD